MAYEFGPSTVTAVLLDSGWHICREFQLFNLGGALKWANAFSFRVWDATSPEYVTGPISSLKAVKTQRVQSLEDRLAQQEAFRAGTDALFIYQHYCDEPTYNELFAAQQGLCAKCGTSLEMARLVHAYEGKLYCHSGNMGCSPLAPHWGSPS